MMMTWRARLPQATDLADPQTDAIPDAVHDGDTLWLCCDQGDYYRKVRACRLFGVYAPELSQPGGPECRQFVRDWIQKWNIGKWPYWVDTIQTPGGKDIKTWDRFVTIVWNSDRTAQLNADITQYVRDHNYTGGTGSG